MQGDNDGYSSPHIHHVYESPSDEEARLGALFNQLDTDGDGRIDIHDLSEGLKKLNFPQAPGFAEVCSTNVCVVVYDFILICW